MESVLLFAAKYMVIETLVLGAMFGLIWFQMGISPVRMLEGRRKKD